MGIKLSPASSAGQHVPVIENRIRPARRVCVLAHLVGLQFHLPRQLFRWLVFFCIARLNTMPSHTRFDATSSTELHRRLTIEYKRDLRVIFGQ
jgi:hypothetical protein